MKLLVTRPVENASATIEKLEALGHEVLHEPLLRVEQLRPELPTGKLDGIILTSSNAVPALALEIADHRDSFPVFTTGAATTRAAVEAGFIDCVSVEGSALEAAAAIQPKDGPQRFLYPCAEQTAHDLVGILAKKNIECVAWPCYRTVEVTGLSDSTRTALEAGEVDCVLLYSARTARCFARLAQHHELVALPILTLSSEICSALPDDLRAQCHHSNSPKESELLDLLPKLADSTYSE